MIKIRFVLLVGILLHGWLSLYACSVVYYVDKVSGQIYVANNEDYWYDVDAYIQVAPGSKKEMARLWYGWDDFAQGGINEAGLFFDGAVTPEQETMLGFKKPKGNLGDEILANCQSVDEAIAYLDQKKIGLNNAHIMFGDSTGNAVVIEWVNNKKEITAITNNHLTMTNFLLKDTEAGNYPCFRYTSIESRIKNIQKSEKSVSLLQAGNLISGAAQPPVINEEGRVGGTLYSTFINITAMEFVLVYKLDNAKVTKLDLKEVFSQKKQQKIILKN